MLLRPGQWMGKGSLLLEGSSLGSSLAAEVQIDADDGAFSLNIELERQDAAALSFGVRVAPNDVGTYIVQVRGAGESLDGTAKLESLPNLGLLWNEAGTVHVTFALFEVSGGRGCRGFLRDGDTVYTWEMAFQLRQETIKGDNVISLGARRRR